MRPTLRTLQASRQVVPPEEESARVFLETERLVLRRFTEADLDNLVDLE